MNLKTEIQNLNNRLDKSLNKLTAAEQSGDSVMTVKITKDIEKTRNKITRLKEQQTQQVSDKSKTVQRLKFNRPITKSEQSDMGKLKKSVRGLVVVHPTTALGREIGVDVITGFAPTKF